MAMPTSLIQLPVGEAFARTPLTSTGPLLSSAQGIHPCLQPLRWCSPVARTTSSLMDTFGGKPGRLTCLLPVGDGRRSRQRSLSASRPPLVPKAFWIVTGARGQLRRTSIFLHFPSKSPGSIVFFCPDCIVDSCSLRSSARWHFRKSVPCPGLFLSNPGSRPTQGTRTRLLARSTYAVPCGAAVCGVALARGLFSGKDACFRHKDYAKLSSSSARWNKGHCLHPHSQLFRCRGLPTRRSFDQSLCVVRFRCSAMTDEFCCLQTR